MNSITKVPRESRWCTHLTAALAVVAALVAAPQAQAFNQFLTAWQNAYPASTTDQTSGRNGCQVCHSDSNGEWNAYGNPIRAAVQGGTPIGTAITNVEGVDSDGNGDSNLAEINANSQPGWTIGANNLIFDSNGNQIAAIDAATIGVQPPLDPVVGNNPPVAVDDAYSTAFETTLTVAAPGVLNNDSDADNDPITAALQNDVSNGTLTLISDGSFTYTPNNGFSGDDTFTYFANDGTDNSNTAATVTITVAAPGNQPPIAVDDTFSTPFQTQLSIAAPGVLGNDSDADGDQLTAVLQTNVSNGVLNLNADGSFTYLPNTAFSGQDSFTYVANDGNVNSNTATVTITVGAAPPAPPADCTGLTIGSATYTAGNNPRLRVRGSGVRDGEYVLTNAFDLNQVFDTARGNRNFNFNVRGPFDPVPCRVQVEQPETGFCAQADVAGAPADCAPTGITVRGDSYTTPRDETLTVPATRLSGLLYNDFDQASPADPLLVLVTTVDTTGTQGTVAVNPDGSFSYTPPAGAPSGGAAYLDDTFTYRASTGTRDSLAATVNVRTLPKQTDFKFMMNYELGMHCTGFEFAYCCVLPAYNSVVSQIAKPAIGDPATSPCFGESCVDEEGEPAEVAFLDGFPRLLEGDPNLGANLDVLGRETVVRDPALDANGEFKKYIVKYWHDSQSRNDGQGKPQIGNPGLQAGLPPHLNTRTLVSDVEGNTLLSWNTRADSSARNADGSFVIGPAECIDPNDVSTCAALGVVQGNGDYGDTGGTFGAPIDNYQNTVWNHLYIYADTEGTIPPGVTSLEIDKVRLGIDVDYPTNFGPAGHPMGPVSGGVYSEDNPFGAHLTFSEDTGTVVFTQMKLVENLPIMLTSPRIWEALGLPLTPFEDTLGFFADPGLVDEDSIRPYVQMSAQLHEANCLPDGSCTAGPAVLGAGGHPVQGFGDAPIDIPNCERCHSAPPTDAFGNINVNSPNVDPENNALVVLETDFWMAYYDLDPAAGDSDWYARLKGAAISILSIHDAQHGTQFTGNFPAVASVPAGVPFDPVTELGGLSEPFPGSFANCLVDKAPTGPACATHADCDGIGDQVCDLPQNTRIGHDSVICQKCHADNVIAVVKSTACGPNAQSCPEGALIPALSQALHFNHRNISEGGFVTFGDVLGRDGGCQGCHPAHRSDGVMDGYPIDLDGNNFYASGDNRLASGGCFVGRDVHSNPNKDIDGAETPEHLNVLGQYLADNVFYNQAAEPGGTEDTRGIWCTNCHSQAGQQMWKAENCTDLINNECAEGENPRTAANMQELADMIVTREEDPAVRLATLESWADPIDPAVNPDLPLSGAGTRTADDSHFIWKNDAGLCNYVAQWAAAGTDPTDPSTFNLSEISAEYDGPVALVEVAIPALGGTVAKCQTGDALSDAPNGTPVNVCDGAPGIPPGGFFICGSYDADGDFTAALTAPPGDSPFCTTQDCKVAADATLADGGATGNTTAQIPFSSSDISTASDGRDHWLSAGEPHCADCHKAPYTEQSGNINPFPPFNYPRRASLMRYSRGHQDVTCQGCHESIHGLYPVTPTIDNTSYAQAAALNNDGSHGPLKCASCHTHVNADQVPTWVDRLTYTDPVDGGPAVPVANDFDAAVSWAHTYTDEADPRADVCQNCHGDFRGSISEGNTEWQIHSMVNRTSRVAMDDAEFNQGAVSGSTDGSDGVCLACHGDESDEVSCTGEEAEEWKRHLTEGRVSEHVWEVVTDAQAGTQNPNDPPETCGW